MLDKDSFAEITAIGLRKSEAGAGHTRFGGHPNLSPNIEWPHDSAGRPMHHLLQLDCAALPVVDPDMPRTGALLFFITGSYEERSAPDLARPDSGAFAVIYQEEPPAALPERAHPDACPALMEGSYAHSPVRYPVQQKKMGFFERIVNTQPKAYSKSGGTGYFTAVPLDAAVFNSFPTSDGKAVFDKLAAYEDESAKEHGLRPLQIMGYAPAMDDLTLAHSQGFRACSDEKALAAYEMGLERDDLLLVQFAHDPKLNLDLVADKYALQFRITRADIRARAFDRTTVTRADFGKDGRWWLESDQPSIYTPAPEELAAEIAFKLLTPFESPSANGNYFCGMPQLPAHLNWPCTSEGYPLGFLMQVDCASLPRAMNNGEKELALPEFPRTGTLFVFADDFMDEVNSDSFEILYVPESTSDLPYRTPPEALKSPPEFCDHNIKNRAEPYTVARPEPRRPFEPVVFANIAAPDYDDPAYDAKAAFRSNCGGALPHEDNAIPSVDLLIDWLPNYRAALFPKDRSSEYSDAGSPVRSIPKCYPWRWGDIAAATEFFPYDEHKHVQTEQRDEIFDFDLITAGEAWKVKASARDALDRIPDADRAAYRDWLLRMDACAKNVPVESTKESNAEYRGRKELEHAFKNIMERLAQPYPYASYGALPETLHYLAYDDSADDLPNAMREVVAELVRFERSDTQLRGYTTYHKPNPDRMFAQPDGEQISDCEVLLFELASGSGLPVTWGDCCWLQIWIEAEDLAAGRFDRIRPTIKW